MFDTDIVGRNACPYAVLFYVIKYIDIIFSKESSDMGKCWHESAESAMKSVL